jgi:SAM-dependent methyltransferase
MSDAASPKKACEAILRRCERGELSAPVALMEMLIATEDEAIVEEVVRARARVSARASEVGRVMSGNARGCARVGAMLRSGVDVPPVNASVEEGIAFCRYLFDWSVEQSEEASVALYSLGSPAILARATQEIVDLLDEWGVLGLGRSALDIGCGIGRMEEALAPRLGRIHGIDVSSAMIAAAGRRCAEQANVVLSTCSGADLHAFGDAAFDLVLAVDSVPYLVQTKMALVETHFAEAARVLAPKGELVVLNFSYRGDLARDRRDVEALAEASGFDVRVNGAAPFRLWNAPAFRLTKRSVS